MKKSLEGAVIGGVVGTAILPAVLTVVLGYGLVQLVDRTTLGKSMRAVASDREAAEMLGLTRIQFLDFLRRTGLGFQVELDDEDFAQIRRWREDPTRLSDR